MGRPAPPRYGVDAITQAGGGAHHPTASESDHLQKM